MRPFRFLRSVVGEDANEMDGPLGMDATKFDTPKMASETLRRDVAGSLV